MERPAKELKPALAASSKMVVLDYVFSEADGLQAYQLVRFAEGEAWNILAGGRLLASLIKDGTGWSKVIGEAMPPERIIAMGAFIDAQHFNLLPAKIKEHWGEYVAEVIMQTDSLYLVVTLQGANFDRFKKLFTSFIGELVEDPWPVEFKVYNADFTDEFLARVF